MKLNEFSYIQKENLPHGKVILIGMMEDGPTGNPFVLKNKEKATFLLGDNEVSRAYEVLVRGGTEAKDIYLFRINGIPGQATLEVDGKEVLTLQTMSSHSEEQNITITTSQEGIAIRSDYSKEAIDKGKRKNFVATYRFDEHPYVSDLAEAITRDAAIGMHGIIADYQEVVESIELNQGVGRTAFLYADEEDSIVIKDGDFPEGSAEEEDSYLSNYWNRFYTHVLGEEFDGESSSKIIDIAAEAIYFPDLPIDMTSELAILASRAARVKTEKQGILCTALFRTSNVPKKKVLEEDEYLNEDGTYFNQITEKEELWEPEKEKNKFIKKLNNLFTKEERDFDEMKHVQIVVGEEDNPEGKIIPAANYHLLNIINQNLESTTNKELPYFTSISSPINKIDVDKLSQNGYICIVESIRRNVVTSKVKSLYDTKSFFDEYYLQKIMSYINYDISDILEEYIGTSSSIYDEANIEELLTDYLDQYIAAEILQDYSLGERELSDVKGNARISIDMVIYGQIDSVKGAVQLNDSGWEVDLWSMTI